MKNILIVLIVDWLVLMPFIILLLRRIFKYSAMSMISIISTLVINFIVSIAIGLGIYQSIMYYFFLIPLIVALTVLALSCYLNQKCFSLSHLISNVKQTKPCHNTIQSILKETLKHSEQHIVNKRPNKSPSNLHDPVTTMIILGLTDKQLPTTNYQSPTLYKYLSKPDSDNSTFVIKTKKDRCQA